MASSSVYYQQNGNGYSEKTLYNALPTHSSAIREKWHRHHPTSSWLLPISLPIPGVRTRRLRILTPNLARLHQFTVTRFGRRRGPLVLIIGALVTVFTIFALHKRFVTPEKNWPTLSPGDPSTLVYKREDIQRIWEWEITAGHYPSSRKRTCARLCSKTCTEFLCSPAAVGSFCTTVQPCTSRQEGGDNTLTIPVTHRDRHHRNGLQACLPRHTGQVS